MDYLPHNTMLVKSIRKFMFLGLIIILENTLEKLHIKYSITVFNSN